MIWQGFIFILSRFRYRSGFFCHVSLLLLYRNFVHVLFGSHRPLCGIPYFLSAPGLLSACREVAV